MTLALATDILNNGFKIRRFSWPMGQFIYRDQFNRMVMQKSLGGRTLYTPTTQDNTANDWNKATGVY